MLNSVLNTEESRIDIVDLQDNVTFLQRKHHIRDVVCEVQALQRLAHVFATTPGRILDELVEISMQLCGADSAGISLEEPAPTTGTQFRWIATAGVYKPFQGAILPSDFSPCSTCLHRSKPQLFRVSKVFLDTIGVDAPQVTDGLLIPWATGGNRGTIWVIAHNAYTLFDVEDLRILQGLADFAAIALRYQDYQRQLSLQAAATAAAAMANDLAHRINNPLQGLINTMFLAGQGGTDCSVFARQASDELVKLSALVKELLHLPTSSQLAGPQLNPASPAATSIARS